MIAVALVLCQNGVMLSAPQRRYPWKLEAWRASNFKSRFSGLMW